MIVSNDGCVDTSDCSYYTVGLYENLSAGEINLYPNPSNEVLIIKTDHIFVSYVIIDLTGKIVQKSDFENSIDVSELDQGTYLIRLFGDQGRIVDERFIKN